MHNWQEKNYDELYRRAAKSTNKLLVNIFDHINILSTYKYEGDVNFGVLLFISNEDSDMLIELERPVKLNNYKGIRKLLAMCSKGVSLLINSENEAYGLGQKKDEVECAMVEFLGYFSWRLTFDSEEVLSCTNLQPQLPNKQKYREIIRKKLSETFGKNNFDKKAIMDVIDIGKEVKGFDYIFHLAGSTDNYAIIENEPYRDVNMNCRTTIALLEACREYNPKVRIILASTFFVNGNVRKLPVPTSVKNIEYN